MTDHLIELIKQLLFPLACAINSWGVWPWNFIFILKADNPLGNACVSFYPLNHFYCFHNSKFTNKNMSKRYFNFPHRKSLKKIDVLKYEFLKTNRLLNQVLIYGYGCINIGVDLTGWYSLQRVFIPPFSNSFPS